jgi:hypothetical protein
MDRVDKPDQPHQHQEEPSPDKKEATLRVVEEAKDRESNQVAEAKEDVLHGGPKKSSTVKEEGNDSKPTERAEDDRGNEAPKVYRPPGLLATPDLQAAVDTCRPQVERIAKDCRAKNRKFR